MKSGKLPAIGRIELHIIEEEIPELLGFEKGELDYAVLNGPAARRLLQGGKVESEYASRGIRLEVSRHRSRQASEGQVSGR